MDMQHNDSQTFVKANGVYVNLAHAETARHVRTYNEETKEYVDALEVRFTSGKVMLFTTGMRQLEDAINRLVR